PAPSRPALAASPGWVPAAVVAGAVLFVEGLIVGRIQPGEGEGSARIVGDLARVSMALGALTLLGGWFAFLLSRSGIAEAISGLLLSVVGAGAYLVSWMVLLKALAGRSADLFTKETLGFEGLALEGRGAALLAIGVLAAGLLLTAFAVHRVARAAWPHFRSGVALNVLAMLHLVVVLLGAVSWVNLRYVPAKLGTGIDLTETGQFSLSDRTQAVLDRVEGELLVFLVDYGAAQREQSSLTGRVRDLLRGYQAACPRMKYRQLDALRGGDELRSVFMEEGLGDALAQITGEEDCVVLAYRPAGEKLVARTKLVPVNQEMTETTSLGAARFRGEGILTNAVNEVVFVQRRVLFLEGHGERSISARSMPAQSLAVFGDALRADNFSVEPLNLARAGEVPKDADLLVIAAPASALPPAEVEAIRSWLQSGGSLLLLLDPRAGVEEAPTGLEDLLGSYGLVARRDAVVVSYESDRGRFATTIQRTMQIVATADEYGRHPTMEALRVRGLVTAFSAACPVLRRDPLPEGVTVEELVFAPREVEGRKPFGAVIRTGRGRDLAPEPGDIVDVRLPVVSTAERKVGATERGGGRIVVVGDTDFAVDLRLETSSPAAVPANRTLLLNLVSWAVRRDVIAIDPKTVETEVVQLRTIDRELAFWVAVVALPVLALGVAVGVWWNRRR
ncbi:MAG: Gldg family protein, partial [Planctomycetaceae bacterium]|nr:Gldg family protein [Planctomycetaceae bacterium]